MPISYSSIGGEFVGPQRLDPLYILELELISNREPASSVTQINA